MKIGLGAGPADESLPGALYYAMDNTSTVIIRTALGRHEDPHRPPEAAVIAAMKRTRNPPGSAETPGPPADPRAGTQLSAPPLTDDLSAARAQLLQSMYEANERCIEMLVNAARTDAKQCFPLVTYLRALFRGLAPEVRIRAAHTPFLLIDMQLSNAAWWLPLQGHPTRPAPLPPGNGSFPRASAVQLGRAMLMLVWHGVRSDPPGTCLLGVSDEVSRIIASLSLTELDRVVERRFRYVRPRWEDRPAFWRALLLSAQSGDARRAREVHLRALQLLTGDLILSRSAMH